MNKIVEIKCATIELLSDDVIHIRYNKDYEVTLTDVVELDSKLSTYLKGVEVYSISDFSNQYNNFTKEAMNFLAKEGKVVKQIKGGVLVINNLPNRLLSRFFISFHKPNYPVKIVANIDNAKSWVTKLK